MGRGRKSRNVAKSIEDGSPETIVSENKEGADVPQPESLAEQGTQLLGTPQIVNGAKKLESKHLSSVRRSQRLQCPAAVATAPSGSLDAERLIQDITVVESEEEDGKEKEDSEEPPQEEHAAHEMSLKERCDYLEQLLLEHKKILEGLTTPKGSKRPFSGETTSEGEMSYKNLYIESQKKVEALMEEKQQLNMKLENTYGQVEVYEKLIGMHMTSSLGKTSDAVLNISKEAIRSAYVSQDTGNGKNARRKKEANGN